MELRPLTIADILDESMELVWSRLWLFLGAVLFIEGPPFLLVNAALGLTWHLSKLKPELLAGCIVSACIQMTFLMLCFMCSRAFMAAAVSKAFQGRRLVFSELIETVLRKAGSLIAHAFLSLAELSIFAFILLLSARLIVDLPVARAKAVVIILALLLIAVSTVSIRFSLSLPLLFLESRSGVVQGLRRSWVLTGGFFWKTATLWVITHLTLLVPVFFSLHFFHYALSIIILFIFLPFAACPETLEACDLKIRKDAYDIWISIERFEENLGEKALEQNTEKQNAVESNG